LGSRGIGTPVLPRDLQYARVLTTPLLSSTQRLSLARMLSIAPLTRFVRVDLSQVLLRAVLNGLVAAALIGLPFVLHYWDEVSAVRGDAVAAERHHVELASRIVAQTRRAGVSELRYLSDQNKPEGPAGDRAAGRDGGSSARLAGHPLAGARSIIEAHLGQLRHPEARGGGCTFTRALPGIDS
jgi:hypothetical protein